MLLPDLLFVGGKKRAGKGEFSKRFIPYGYTVYHIVQPYLEQFASRQGISFEEYLVNKEQYRAQLQKESTATRATDPNILLDLFRQKRPSLPDLLVVEGIRFINEMTYGLEQGALCIRIATSDEERRRRFIESGTDLALFDDPFESEVDFLPVHAELSGEQDGDWYVPTTAAIYDKLLNYQPGCLQA